MGPRLPFGELLRGLRRAAGFTLRRLGAALGVTHVCVGNWERGDRLPPEPDRLAAIVGVLGCPERLPELLAAAEAAGAVNVQLVARPAAASVALLLRDRVAERDLDPATAAELRRLLAA
jgi:transcriptional regulator with XRE-family HTH domain